MIRQNPPRVKFRPRSRSEERWNHRKNGGGCGRLRQLQEVLKVKGYGGCSESSCVAVVCSDSDTNGHALSRCPFIRETDKVRGKTGRQGHKASRARKGHWRMSQNSLVRRAMFNNWLEEQGLLSLETSGVPSAIPTARRELRGVTSGELKPPCYGPVYDRWCGGRGSNSPPTRFGFFILRIGYLGRVCYLQHRRILTYHPEEFVLTQI